MVKLLESAEMSQRQLAFGWIGLEQGSGKRRMLPLGRRTAWKSVGMLVRDWVVSSDGNLVE